MYVALVFVIHIQFYNAMFVLFSSPEHKVVLRVSYCDRPLPVVRRRPPCVVRRPSCVVRRA